MGLVPAAMAWAAALAQPAAPAPAWDLTPIYADPAAAAADRAAAEAALPALARWKGRLSDPATVRAALDARAAVRTRVQRQWIWANARLNRDGSDSQAGVDAAAAGALWARLGAATAYIEPELVALGDARLAALAAAPALAPYRLPLERLRTRAAHVLPAEREALVAEVQPLLAAPATIRDTLFNVELPWPSITVGGAPLRLTGGAMRRVMTDPDRATRQKAWEAFAATQEQFKGTQAALLTAYLSGIAWEARTRGWSGQTEMVTAADPMPAAAFAALGAEAERAAQGPLARYLALKAGAMKLPSLAGYDLAAPLVPDTRRYSIDEARALTLAAVAPLGKDYGDRLARGLSGRWIDWAPGPGKAPGGTTLYGVADLPAYIVISFAGDAQGLAMYAHEWGHWMHWDYARAAGHPADTVAPAVSTGDVAPFVHEMLVADRQVAAATTPQQRIVALTAAIEALRTAYYGVVAQASFDVGLRAAADKGTPLTPDAVSAIYCDAHRRYAPPGIARDPRDCLGWVTEPYVYYELYFYRYLLATSAGAWFAERVAAGDKAAAGQLTAFLRAGGSADAATLLKQAGFDPDRPASYAAMTRRVERLTAALEKEWARR